MLTQETNDLIRNRDVARNTAALTNLEADWGLYKNLRNKCTAAIRKERKVQLEKKYNECINDKNSSKLFTLTKKQLGMRSGGPPETFHLDGRKITKPEELAEVQIKYFTDKVRKLKSTIQGTNTDPLELLKENQLRNGGQLPI